MIDRRVRKESKQRAVVKAELREALRQGLDETFAHLGVNPKEHAEDHQALKRILPALVHEVIPWASAERALSEKRKEWFNGVRAELTKDAARLITVFILLSIFYGGFQALVRMVGP